MNRCSNCGREIQSEAKFCRFCGASQEIALESESPDFCPNCGIEISPGTTSCGSCGTQINIETVISVQEPIQQSEAEPIRESISEPELPNRCPRCGQELASRTNFCRYCGAPLETGRPVPSSDSPPPVLSAPLSSQATATFQSPFEKMVSSVKQTYSKISQKGLKQTSKEAYEALKIKMAEKLDKTVLDLENPLKYRDLNSNQKKRLVSAIATIRTRIDSGELTEEELQETQLYIRDLKERLKGDKCLVCLKPLKPGDFVVACPSCSFAGHNQHLTDWIANRGECPLCKSQLQTKDLVHFQLVDNGN